MEVNILQNAIVLIAFLVFAGLGGRLLAETAFARTATRRIVALGGVAACIICFMLVLEACA